MKKRYEIKGRKKKKVNLPEDKQEGRRDMEGIIGLILWWFEKARKRAVEETTMAVAMTRP